jgi:hypothetical protein
MDATEITRFDNLEALLSDGDFSQVFVLEVGVDLGFFSILIVLEIELGDVGFSVSDSLLFIGISFVNFILTKLDL